MTLSTASERLVDVFLDVFAAHHPEQEGREAREKTKGFRSINYRFAAIHERLRGLLEAKRLDRGRFADTVLRHIPGVFDLVRRQRNDAGHPSHVGPPSRETLFVDLGVFVEYNERLGLLLETVRGMHAPSHIS